MHRSCRYLLGLIMHCASAECFKNKHKGKSDKQVGGAGEFNPELKKLPAWLTSVSLHSDRCRGKASRAHLTASLHVENNTYVLSSPRPHPFFYAMFLRVKKQT